MHLTQLFKFSSVGGPVWESQCIIQMLKNKSSSVSISNRGSGSASKNNSSSNTRKTSNTRPKKPTIDRQIAKKLDTLDRQGLKYLKQSLRASRFLERDKNLEVEEQIPEGEFAERPLRQSKRIANEIEEEIAEIVQIQQDEETTTQPEIKRVISGGRVKTTIKARPISAVQKESSFSIPQNYSIDLHSQERPFGKLPSPHSESLANPFKKPKPSKSQPQELNSLLKRIEKLEFGQRAQLQVILERMEKGEIESVEMSSDVIVLGRSNSKAEMNTVEYQTEQRRGATGKPVRSAMQKNREKGGEIEEEIEEDLTVQETKGDEEEQQKKAVTLKTEKTKEKKQENQESPATQSQKSSSIPIQQQMVAPTKPKISVPSRMPSTKNIIAQQIQKLDQPSLPPKKDKKKAPSLTLRLLDTWGHQSIVGLTQLQLFDTKGRKIPVTPQQLPNPNKKLLKLFTGKTFTVDESEMWWTSIPRPPMQCEVEVNCRQVIGAVRIWNYNKSLLESDKGVKEAEIQIKGTRVWVGEIRRGTGNEVEDYSTLVVIGLEPGVEVPRAESPFKSQTSPFKPQQLKIDKRAPTEVNKPESTPKVEVPSLKSNKPTWLQGTMVASKLQQLRKEQLKSQQQAKQVQNTKRKMRGRQSTAQIDKPSSSKLQPVLMSEQKVKPIQQGLHLKFEPAQRERYLQKQAEDVCRDVQNSLLNVKKNLHLEGDDIFTEMLGNRKSIAVLEKDKLQPTQQQEMSRFKREDSTRRRLNEEVVTKQQVMQNKSTEQTKASKANLKIIEGQGNVKDIIMKELVKEVKQAKQVQKPKQAKHDLPSVRQLNKASQLDNLIDELNSMIPTTQKVTIPELPQGQILKLNFLLTWGDPYYVGMAGLEFFNHIGEPVQVQAHQIRSKYSMPIQQNKKDQRTVDKLVNGVYLTTDGHNQWLSPFQKDSNITVDFGKTTIISMIRIWNYNESRIHSTRGVRYLSIELDGKTIFQGQIRKSSGQIFNQQRLCEYILFTGDAGLHKKICQRDWLSTIKQQQNVQEQSLRQTLVMFKRPTTGVKQVEQTVQKQQAPANINYEKRFIQQYQTPTLPKGYNIRIVIRSTWGDLYFVGLNGVEIYDSQGVKLLNNQKYKLKAHPSSVNVLPGYEKDVRTVDKLVNGVNQTFNDTNMWLAPFVNDLERLERKEVNTITFRFEKSIVLGAIDFYNYTKTPTRGAREIEIHLDETLIFMGYIRRGPSRDQLNPTFKTTVTFCKDPQFLKKIRFLNYNEDNLEQQVGLVNEQKSLSAPTPYEQLPRPGTSVTGKEPQQKFL